LGLARRLSWPARLSGGAAPLERTSQATSLALTRGARSGGCHVSGRSGSQTRSLSSEGSSLRGCMGRPVLGPISLLGFASYKLGLLGTPSLFPVTKDAGVLILEVAFLATMSGPTTIMEHQPNEELAFGRSTSFAQDFGSFDRMLANEKEPIS